MSSMCYNKIIDIADFSNPELLPYLRDIARGEMQRFGLSEPAIIPDSKQWECAMMLRCLSEQGVLRPGAMVAGIGAGTEETTFALAEKGCIVFPTDRYLEVTPWSDVAPAGMMVRPDQYSQFSHPRGSVIPVHSDARWLGLPSNMFDAVYSAGSIEHFGSLESVAAAAEEIGRILKPGGVAVLSTEFRIDGPNDRRWFSDDCILFTPALLEEFIVGPSGLELIGEADFTTSPATYDSRVVLADFLDRAKKVQTLADKRNAYPNLVLFHEGYLFCSVHLALRKSSEAAPQAISTHAARFADQVESDAIRASGVLTGQIVDWTRRFQNPLQPSLVTEEQLEQLHARLRDREALIEQQVEHLKMLDDMTERQNTMITHQKISIDYHIDLVQERERELEAVRADLAACRASLLERDAAFISLQSEIARRDAIVPSTLVRVTTRLEDGIRRRPVLLKSARISARALRKIRRMLS